MEEFSWWRQILRSCGKRLTCLTAAIEGGYQVPSPSQQREIHDEYTEIANKYFEDDFWRGSQDEEGIRGPCTTYGTSMGAFHLLSQDIIEAWKQNR